MGPAVVLELGQAASREQERDSDDQVQKRLGNHRNFVEFAQLNLLEVFQSPEDLKEDEDYKVASGEDPDGDDDDAAAFLLSVRRQITMDGELVNFERQLFDFERYDQR